MPFKDQFRDPLKVFLGAFAAGAVLIYLLPLLWSLSFRARLEIPLTAGLHENDFVNYWMAARMTLVGDYQLLFVHDSYFAELQRTFGANIEIRSWSYPPHFLLLLWPLGFLTYPVAFGVFLFVTLGLFICATVVFWRAYGRPDAWVLILALPGYLAMMLSATQNGFLTAALLLLGFAWMKSKPFLAGMVFGLLSLKPQLVFLVPLLLVLDRNWRTLAWSAVTCALLVALSLALFEFESWRLYATETLRYQQFVMTDWYGIFLCMMPTAFGSIRALGLTPELAAYVQWPFSVAGILLVFLALWRDASLLRRIFAVTCGTFVITPYAFNYDMGALTVVASVLVASADSPNSRAGKMVVALVAVLSGIVANLGRANLPLAPLILFLSLAVVVVPGIGLHTKMMPVLRKAPTVP